MKERIILYLFCLFFIPLAGQTFEGDWEEKWSYREIQTKINALEDKQDTARFALIHDFIDYAKQTQNPEKIWQGYDLARLYGKPKYDTVYCDSMIWIAKKGLDSITIADSYHAKSLHYNADYRYQKALDAIDSAHVYLTYSDNKLIQNSITYAIGLIYSEVEDYDNALKYLKQSMDFFKQHHPITKDTDYRKYYILSLDRYISINAQLGNDSVVKKYNKELKKFVEREKFSSKKHYAINNKGINDYYQKKYDGAIKYLKRVLKEAPRNSGNHLTEHYYIGLSYWHKHQKQKALPYFMYIDSIYSANGKLPKEFHAAYKYLIEYAQEKNQPKDQLVYVEKLLALNRLFEKNYKKIIPELQGLYTTHYLEKEKERLEKLLAKSERKKHIIIVVSMFLVLVLAVYSFYVFRKNKILNKQFKSISKDLEFHQSELKKVKTKQPLITPKNNIAQKVKEINHQSSADKLGMSESVYQSIIKYLEIFEEDRGYLNTNITLKTMADNAGTNASYLSKVINQQKGVSFSAYLHKWRIAEATKSMYYGETLHLSVQEIAQKSGYNSEVTFAKEFKRINKLTPGQFLKKVKSQKKYREKD